MSVMKRITQRYVIDADINDVWLAFVNPSEIGKWGAGPATMSDKEGFNFKLWGGDVFGKNLRIEKNKQIVQEWYGGGWKEPSRVTFKFQQTAGGVQIDLIHENVPDSEAADIEDGWERYYIGEIKDYLERG